MSEIGSSLGSRKKWESLLFICEKLIVYKQETQLTPQVGSGRAKCCLY